MAKAFTICLINYFNFFSIIIKYLSRNCRRKLKRTGAENKEANRAYFNVIVSLILMTRKAIIIEMLDNVLLSFFVMLHKCIELIFTLNSYAKCLSIVLQTNSGCGLESHRSNFDRYPLITWLANRRC